MLLRLAGHLGPALYEAKLSHRRPESTVKSEHLSGGESNFTS